MEESIPERIADEIEELFQPKPGGLVDTHRKRVAREAERAQEINTDEGIEQPSYKAIKVAPQSPEIFSAITYNIGAGANIPILPASPYRYRATIMNITAASVAIIAKDSGAAISGVGFNLPPNIPIVLFTRAQVVAFSPTAIQVSVIAEIYAPES